MDPSLLHSFAIVDQESSSVFRSIVSVPSNLLLIHCSCLHQFKFSKTRHKPRQLHYHLPTKIDTVNSPKESIETFPEALKKSPNVTKEEISFIHITDNEMIQIQRTSLCSVSSPIPATSCFTIEKR